MATACVYQIVTHFENFRQNEERFETMVISNVCTKEVSKFSWKIFANDVLLEEKPGAIKYTLVMIL